MNEDFFCKFNLDILLIKFTAPLYSSNCSYDA